MRVGFRLLVVLGCANLALVSPSASQQLGINLSHQISASHGHQLIQQQIYRQQRGFGASQLDLDVLAATSLSSDPILPSFTVPAAGLPSDFRLSITNLDQTEAITSSREEQSATVLFSHSPLFRASN